MSCDLLGRLASVLDSKYSLFKKRNKERYNFYLNMVTDNSDSLFREETHFVWKSFTYPSIITICQ